MRFEPAIWMADATDLHVGAVAAKADEFPRRHFRRS
jgi:hypothetical protein